jgi:hypothetical protein
VSITFDELDLLTVVPPHLDESTPGTTVWRDDAHRAIAFGTTLGLWHWVRVAGAGTYRFPVVFRDLTVEAGVVPEHGARPAIVKDSYFRTVVPMALHAYGYEVLHGSAVSLPAGVVAMCADRETGKSTIAFALQRRGHAAIADDAVVVSVPAHGEESSVGVEPSPFELRLRGPSALHFDAPSRRDTFVTGDVRAPLRPAERPALRSAERPALHLAAIVMLVRHEGPVGLVRLAARDAFARTLGQSYAFSLDEPERKRAMLGRYMRLVTLVPTYQLAFPSGLEHLDEICDAIEKVARPIGRA